MCRRAWRKKTALPAETSQTAEYSSDHKGLVKHTFLAYQKQYYSVSCVNCPTITSAVINSASAKVKVSPETKAKAKAEEGMDNDEMML